MISLSDLGPLRVIGSTGQSYAYMGNELFSMFPNQDGLARFAHIDGRTEWFHGGIDMARIEQKILDMHKSELEDQITGEIGERITHAKKDLLKGRVIDDMLRTLTPVSYDQYILYHIIGGFYRRYKDVETQGFSDIRMDYLKEIDLLNRQFPLLKEMYPEQILVLSKEKVYFFREGLPRHEDYVQIGRSRFNLRTTSTIDDVLRKYDSFFNEKLHGIMGEGLEMIEKKLLRSRTSNKGQTERLDTLQRGLDSQRKKERIWFEKVDDSSFDVYLKIHPFVMERFDTHYFFRKPIIIKSRTQFEKGYGQSYPPTVISPKKLRHPFLKDDLSPYGGRDVCWAGDSALRKIGISLNKIRIQNLSDTRFSDNVIRLLKEAEFGLTSGYVDGVGPMNDLTPSAYAHRIVPPSQIPPGVKIYHQNNGRWTA